MQVIAQAQSVQAQLIAVVKDRVVDAQRFFPFVGEFAKDMVLIMNGLQYSVLEVKDDYVVQTPVTSLKAEQIRKNREWFAN